MEIYLDRETRLKRLQIIGKRRGSKELDLIFSKFIDKELQGLDDPILSDFEEFLELSESALEDYFLGGIVPPAKFRLIFNRILLVLPQKG